MSERPDGMPDQAWTAASIVEALQRLRFDAGDVSYGEIAQRIARLRASRGASDAASRIARSTVYDVFRPGRARLNATLVAEIVTVLGGTDADAEQWHRRCLRARGAAPAAPATASASARTGGVLGEKASPRRAASSAGHARWMRVGTLVLIMALCVGVNIAGGTLIIVLALPLFLDMIGTAVAAIALGPWFAVGVAVATHAAGAAMSQSLEGFAYLPVNIVGGLLWAFGVRVWGFGRSPVRFLALNVMVAVACTIVAVPITLLFFDGLTIHSAGLSITEKLLAMGDSMLLAVFSSNMLTSVLDKLIAGFVALGLSALVVAWIGGEDLTRGAHATAGASTPRMSALRV